MSANQKIIKLNSKTKITVNGKTKELIIVDCIEKVDPVNGYISEESPLGRSIIGHKVNDIINAVFPNQKKYSIVIIKVY